jgi:hypothetical protein
MITDPTSIDWKRPDHDAICKQRLEALKRIRQKPESLPSLRDYYRERPWVFISDWGITFEPRNAEIGQPTIIPFVLFDKQTEWVQWVMRHWRERTPGLCEKSRDVGVSWLAMGLACTLCIFRTGMTIGVGSRKTEYVDQSGSMKPLLQKARTFMKYLPPEFTGGWDISRDAPLMRILFPETGSMICGEGGDDIGRGDRCAIYFVDEYAHFERPELTEASLSQTTNCRIDMSSVRGMNNPFAQKRWGGKVDVFVFDWRDDPRKDEAWYEKQKEQLDPVVVAQEIDRDYSASVAGMVIPGAWVRSAIDAHEKLGIAPAGIEWMALDVADEGLDKNAAVITKGIEIVRSEEWSGKGSDILATVHRAFELCDELGLDGFDYDSDGLGQGVRGDARGINDQRKARGQRELRAIPFRGSETVHDPKGLVDGTKGMHAADKGRTNQDYFANRKAQGWWALRRRFQQTYRWVVEGVPSAPDDIISISSKCPNHHQLVSELSQPTYQVNGVGKIVINKKPDQTRSPNLADAAMMRFAPKKRQTVEYTEEMVRQVLAAPRRRRW